MTKIKKINWDDCNIQGITSSEYVSFSAIYGSVENGISVSAKYKGKNINMKIITEISPDLFEAEILDMEPNIATYEDISIGDRVEIPRQSICWIQKK